MRIGVYLGGPIRNNKLSTVCQADVVWREEFVKLTEKYPGLIAYNPLDHQNVSDITIYTKDLLMMQRADIGVFNFGPFISEGYPTIGAIFEIGYMTALGKPCYIFFNGQQNERRTLIMEHPMFAHCICCGDFEEFLEEIIG